MKTLKQEWLDRAKKAGVKDPDPNNRMCQAFAHFDGPGWTKFAMAGLIIDLSEKLDKLSFYVQIGVFPEILSATDLSMMSEIDNVRKQSSGSFYKYFSQVLWLCQSRLWRYLFLINLSQFAQQEIHDLLFLQQL